MYGIRALPFVPILRIKIDRNRRHTARERGREREKEIDAKENDYRIERKWNEHKINDNNTRIWMESKGIAFSMRSVNENQIRNYIK